MAFMPDSRPLFSVGTFALTSFGSSRSREPENESGFARPPHGGLALTGTGWGTKKFSAFLHTNQSIAFNEYIIFIALHSCGYLMLRYTENESLSSLRASEAVRVSDQASVAVAARQPQRLSLCMFGSRHRAFSEA